MAKTKMYKQLLPSDAITIGVSGAWRFAVTPNEILVRYEVIHEAEFSNTARHLSPFCLPNLPVEERREHYEQRNTSKSSPTRACWEVY
jgi:hypothetical protein